MRNNLTELTGAENCKVIPMGISGELFRPTENKEKIILSCRSLTPIYDVQTLIKACGEIKERLYGWRVMIAGDGILRDELEKMSSKLGLDNIIEFIGRVEQKELARFMSDAAIYVSTSLSDGASGSLLEALSSAMLPVISDIPANREWVTDGKDGYIFPTKDYISLGKAIAKAINNYADFYAILKEKRETVLRKVAWEVVAKQFIGLYEGLVK